MKLDSSLTTILILPGIPAVLLTAYALVSGSVRAAVIPLFVAGFCGIFCLSVVPKALHLLASDRSYRNASNIACVTIGSLASLVPVSLFLLVAIAIIRTAVPSF